MDIRHLFCRLLNCGTFDLNMLEKMDIEIDDVLDYINDNLSIQTQITFNDLLYATIQVACNETQQQIAYKEEDTLDTIINEIEELQKQYKNLYVEKHWDKIDEIGDKINVLEWELIIIKEINIFNDVDEFYNSLDTHITLVNNIEIYQKYFQEELDYFKKLTNISLI